MNLLWLLPVSSSQFVDEKSLAEINRFADSVRAQ